MENDRVYGNKWHLDRSVPIALLITIGGGSFSAIVAGTWFAAVITSDVNTLKSQVPIMNSLSERVIRLETKLDGGLEEIKRMIRQPQSERR